MTALPLNASISRSLAPALSTFCLIQLQAAELFPPAVVRLNGDLCLLASLRCALPVRYFNFNLPQQRHDLLRLVFLHRHIQLSFRVIFSHSRWTNSSQARQQEWRAEVAVNRKPSTVRAAESHLACHILPRLGSLHLQEITAKRLQAFVTTMAATGVTRKTIENVLQSLFSILHTARLFGCAVPAVKRGDLVLPPPEAGREVRFLDAHQMGQIITKAREPFATMFALLGMSGLRAGELLGLKVCDLDFSRKVIHIRWSVDSRTKKEQSTKSRGSASDVPIPLALEKRLKDFLRAHYRENPNGYLFANRNGNSYSVGKVTEYGLWPVQDILGIPHTGLHAFRHAAASELLEEGAPLTVVQRQMRHCDARTTLQKYGHVVGDAQRRAVNTLAQKIERFTTVELVPSTETVPSST
jgi:integrase